MNEIIRVGQVSNDGSQSGMVYDAEGLFPTLCACTHGYAMGNILIKNEGTNMNELIQVGNLEGKHEQSNRVYSEEGVCPTLMAGQRMTCTGGYVSPKIMVNTNKIIREIIPQPVGNTGGYSYLYTVKNKLNNKGVDNMWSNNLEKFNFDMEEIRVFDVFAGIGALHQSLKELGVPVRVTNLSEIDIDATISYASGHIENFKDLEFEYPSDEEMKQWLIDRNIGYSYEKGKSSVPRMKKEKLKLAYKASYLLNNLGDISKIKYDEIEDFDLMNFSFSCTDLSNAGKQKGMKNEDGTPTRSGLYVYGIKAIKAKKPKYIMIENVKGLIQKKFIDDFYSIVEELEDIGYNCYYPTKEDKKGNKSPMCLNAKNYGIPQNRERIFVICVRKDIDRSGFEFPQGFDSGVRLKDVLEDTVDEKYYLSQEIQDRFKLNGKTDVNHNELNIVGSSAPECRTIGQRDITYGVNGVMSTLTATDYKQPKQILDNSGYTVCEQRCDEGLRFFKDNICGSLRTIDSCGDKRIIENGAIRGRYDSEGKIEQQLELRKDGITNTLTTVEKDNVLLENQQEIKIRKLTPLECWRLMGFQDENFYKAQECGISDSQLYKQAGNSIVVNCLYYIFKNLFKEYIEK